MTRTIYIAASSYELDRARAAMAMARASGYEITHDWTLSVAEHGGNPLRLPSADRRRFACADLDAIDNADVVWLLATDDHVSRGANIEYGYALASRAFVIVSGAVRGSIFYDVSQARFPDDISAAEFLKVQP